MPAPLYVANASVPYCHTCGRVINSKKTSSTKNANNEIKYCSDRCRSRRPGPEDRKIEKAIASLLNGEPDSGIEQTAARSKVVKGDPRLIVTCDEIEEVVFGSRFDPEKVFGRRKNRKSRAIPDRHAEWRSVDMESDDGGIAGEENGVADQYDTDGSVASIDRVGGVSIHIRPPQDQSEVNFSVGGERGKQEKIEESAEDLEKRRQGQRRAEEREMVRKAARRVVIFGVEVPKDDMIQQSTKKHAKGKSRAKKRGDVSEDEAEAEMTVHRRKAEAIMAGKIGRAHV